MARCTWPWTSRDRSAARPEEAGSSAASTTNGDGKADRVNVFARMEHPRGVIAQDGKVWVLHPPFLSVFRDEDGDGTSDRQEVLVSGPDDQPDRRAGRRPHDQRHPHGARRLDLHRRRRLRVPRREGEGRHDALATGRRHPPRAARRHRAGGLRHRPAQPVRHRDRPVSEPLHARQHQRRGRLGRAREPPDPDRRLRLFAEVRQLPRRDHAAPRGLRPGRRHRRAVRCTTSAGPKPIAAPSSRATGAGARSTGTT